MSPARETKPPSFPNSTEDPCAVIRGHAVGSDASLPSWAGLMDMMDITPGPTQGRLKFGIIVVEKNKCEIPVWISDRDMNCVIDMSNVINQGCKHMYG